MSSLVPDLVDEEKERVPQTNTANATLLYQTAVTAASFPLMTFPDLKHTPPQPGGGGGFGGGTPPPPGEISDLYYNLDWIIPTISQPDMSHCTIVVTALSVLSKVEACRAIFCIVVSISATYAAPLCPHPFSTLILLLLLIILCLCPSCPLFSSSIPCTLPLPLLLLILFFNYCPPSCCLSILILPLLFLIVVYCIQIRRCG